MRFCTEEVLSSRSLRVIELGCVRDSGLRGRLRVKGVRRGLRFRFRRRVRLPLRIEVFRSRSRRRVARFRRSRSFTWKGARRLRSGRYFVRVTSLGATGKTDRREVAFSERRHRSRVSRRAFSRRERCSLLRSATLGSPLFGRSLKLRYRLGSRARVSIRVLRGRRTVLRLRGRSRRAGAHRARLRTAGLPRGGYRVRIVVRAGRRRAAATLYARRF
jgi:hypothetical protein